MNRMCDALRRWKNTARANALRPSPLFSPALESGHESALSVRFVRTLREQTSDVDSLPAVMDPTGRGVESEVVAAVVGRLVVLPPNSIVAQVTQQQRPDTAVRDNGDCAAAVCRNSENFFDSTYDPALRVDGLFPTADVLVGMGKEQIGHGFELGPG